MFYLHKKSWAVIKEEVKISDTVIVPLGSMESHGPHNAVGCCYLLADSTSRDVGKRTEISVTPTIPFGVADSYKNFPGTISVSSQVLYNFVKETTQCLIQSGFKKIAFFSAHGGNNLSVLRELSNELRDTYGVLCVVVHLWNLLKQATPNYNTGFWEPDLVIGHGGEPVTSVMMHLFPEVVDLKKADWRPLEQPFENFETKSSGSHLFKGIRYNIPLQVDEVASLGGTGDPRRGSAEKGVVLYNNLIESLVDFIEAFKKIDPTRAHGLN